MPDVLINVAAIRRRTRVSGPGWRAAVWVQGCTIRCPGCFNPDTHPHVARHLWDPERLADELLRGDVEGVSLLGGEPFEQAAACAALARAVQDAGKTVVTYSGYTVSDLSASTLPETRALIAATDLLIAGPYLAAARNDGRGWHGSTNQEMVFLSDRYGPEIFEVLDALPVVELRTDGERLDCTGIPAQVDLHLLRTLERRRDPAKER
ncbi:MAG TPA: 4Fe-4S single cluster domain-containing protein [Nannocystaceae bacterium]|nr:4Fe-4S single cluster domain-containing protein [Nannocystaceae bacterium]